MEFTIEANGIRLSVDADFDLDLTYVQDFLDSLVPTFEFFYDEIEIDEEEEDEIEYDEDGVAWWYDEENDELYYCEGDIEDEDDWVLVEE
jgi:hypothetical protein